MEVESDNLGGERLLPSYLKSTALMSKDSRTDKDETRTARGLSMVNKNANEMSKTPGTGYSDSHRDLKHFSKHAYIESISKVVPEFTRYRSKLVAVAQKDKLQA